MATALDPKKALSVLLAATLVAPQMTSRPVTPAGQVVFGLACGALGMVLRLYVVFPLAFYIAVLVMNTLTPALERITRPRVLGRRGWPIAPPRGRGSLHR